jgi:hypothetical protein
MVKEICYERRKYTRFKDISVSERILNALFLLTIGLGYLSFTQLDSGALAFVPIHSLNKCPK